MTSCLFCKIIRGDIPCYKIYESALSIAFMDIHPIARRHVLVIPKEHAASFHLLSEASMADVGITLGRVSKAIGADQYNLLQNNGRLAHQEVMHVHFHVIPKLDSDSGLIVGWPVQDGIDSSSLERDAEELKKKINQAE